MSEQPPSPSSPQRRRRSSFFRNTRSSLVVVEEIRTNPFKVGCLLTAVLAGVFGIRDVFFAGQPFTADPTEKAMLQAGMDALGKQVYQHKEGMIGLGHLMHSAIRLDAVLTQHVADLYRVMMLLVAMDLGLFFVSYRAGFLVNIPTMYVGIICCVLVNDMYVLYWARRAYMARSKGPTVAALKSD